MIVGVTSITGGIEGPTARLRCPASAFRQVAQLMVFIGRRRRAALEHPHDVSTKRRRLQLRRRPTRCIREGTELRAKCRAGITKQAWQENRSVEQEQGKPSAVCRTGLLRGAVRQSRAPQIKPSRHAEVATEIQRRGPTLLSPGCRQCRRIARSGLKQCCGRLVTVRTYRVASTALPVALCRRHLGSSRRAEFVTADPAPGLEVRPGASNSY